MKIRNGFVSNSSSSSFMLITSKDNLKDICSEFNEQLKNIKHPTVKLASNLLSSIYTNADEIKDEQSLLKHFYCGTIEDLKDEKPELVGFDFNKNRLYEVRVCSDSGEGSEYYLYEEADRLVGFESEKMKIIY